MFDLMLTAPCLHCQQPAHWRTGRQRPRLYCSHACRQRAYELRNNLPDPHGEGTRRRLATRPIDDRATTT
jgi:hypothetical protein